MSLARVFTRAQCGLEALPVSVEAHVGGGLPAISIVGLPEAAVRESKDRVRAAVSSCGFQFPVGRVTVNLAPADLPKEGGRFDLPIALGVLAASGQLPAAGLEAAEFLGELSLGGRLRPVDAVLCAALAAGGAGRVLVVPEASATEAALAGAGDVRVATHLLEVARHVAGQGALPQAQAPDGLPARPGQGVPDLADVRGQGRGRRALEIAAAGGHNLLMVGPPGTGKTLLARRLPGLLPPLSRDEAIEAASVWSAAGYSGAAACLGVRPFRAPHHTASAAALTGGGAWPRPGEASLAHRGVLFLDELPEFDRRALEALRQPLEDGELVVSRAAAKRRFPAVFMLVAAMNPCPCGYLGDPSGRCRCSADAVARYRSRVSGPLLDRIDLVIHMPRPAPGLLLDGPGEGSEPVRIRVMAARERQLTRQAGTNARTGVEALVAELGSEGRALLEAAARRFDLSPRAVHRALRVARTVADLAGRSCVEPRDLQEALSFRLGGGASCGPLPGRPVRV
jgi:magnesium chelatase family protein